MKDAVLASELAHLRADIEDLGREFGAAAFNASNLAVREELDRKETIMASVLELFDSLSEEVERLEEENAAQAGELERLENISPEVQYDL